MLQTRFEYDVIIIHNLKGTSMKRYIILLFTGFIIIGCQSTITSPVNPTQVQQLSSATTQIASTQSVIRTATQSAEQTATQDAVNLLTFGTPTPLPIGMDDNSVNIIFRDDFDKVLLPDWQWSNEDPLNWSLTELPGSLQINVLGGYLNLHNASNVLTMPPPPGDFYIETALLFDPDTDNQFAGLFMYESDNDYIQTGIAYCSPIYECIGQGLYIDIYQDGKLLLPRNAIEFSQNSMAMRMARSEDKIIIYASPDGRIWYRIYEFTMGMDIKRVGVITGQSVDELPKPAVFEYFEIGTFK